MKNIRLSKQNKILLALLELANNSKKNLTFEDVVVAIYKKFPEDFHLKGYKEYPDADLIRRPLYQFRDQGLLLVRNMIFSLTDKGLDEATKMKKQVSRKSIETNEKFDRYIDKEIKRIRNLSGFNLFKKSGNDNIFDTDFFDYLGISVKSDRIEFKSRIRILDDVSRALNDRQEEEFVLLNKFHKYMINKFKEIINYKLRN